MSDPSGSATKLSDEHLSDIQFALSKMNGADRRAFQAEITLKYCNGSARNAESRFGWSRKTVSLGLEEKRSGLICAGAQAVFSGTKRWEDKHPDLAEILREIAEAHSQQDPTFKTTIAFTRLTTAEAIQQLRNRGVQQEQLPSPSTMAVILNRMGYRLKKVVKAKPKKKSQKQMPSLKISKPKINPLMEGKLND